jgi:menaquinol-cytochrome c reductase cytochrome b/c subunit
MEEEERMTTAEIFPKGSNKSYALVELVKGESAMVDRGPDDTVFSFPVVLLWEILILLGVTFSVFVFSLIKQAPLEELANPFVTTNPAKAPWYFVGLQELLEHMHPVAAGIAIPGILVLFLLALPYIDRAKEGRGIWFSSSRGKKITTWTSVYTVIVMTAYIVLDNAFSIRETLRGIAPQWVAQGLVPGAILMLLVMIPLLVLWRMRANMREIMLALFTTMITSAVVFTLSGFLFRGPGFKLYWPWQMPDGYNPFNDL